jgi:hypothetical protein
MNKILIIFGIIALIVISVLVYIYFIKPSTTTIQPISEPKIELPSQPVNAVCLSNSTPLTLDESYYTFDNKSVLGSTLITTNKSINTNVEYFALSGTVYADPSQLDPNKNYLIGTLVKTNILVPAQNGGTECPEFPKKIYKLTS